MAREPRNLGVCEVCEEPVMSNTPHTGKPWVHGQCSWAQVVVRIKEAKA